ncbi:MAG TPA: ACT domain-containing protein [Phycisphaerae bacterium]|jgi:hypothetical protein
MQNLVQFSVFLVNKPGVLSQVCSELARAKVNITAMAMMDSMEHGVLRLITDAPDRTRQVLRKLNIPTTETEVLAVSMPNRPGAVADVCDRLTQGHIHISYVYCTTSDKGGRTVVIFKVSDMRKAMKLIEDHRNERRDMKIKVRRPQMGRVVAGMRR